MVRDIDELTEIELIKEIKKTLKTEGDVSIDRLEFNMEDDTLIISGAVSNEEDLSNVQQILSDYFGDHELYHIDVDVVDPDNTEYVRDKNNWEEEEDDGDDLEEVDEEGNAAEEDAFFNDDEEF